MKAMMKRTLAILLALALLPFAPQLSRPAAAVSAIWDGAVAEGFAGGSGMEDDPYRIETAAQLAYLAQSVNNGNSYEGKHLRLDADILLNDTTNWELWGSYNEAGNLIAPVNIWTPIGTGYECSFGGILEGNNKTVSGIFLNGGNLCGLFGYIKEATVRDLSIEASYIHSDDPDHYAGSVAGLDYNQSNVSNCHNYGKVSCGVGETGGVIGHSAGMVENCSNYGEVYGNGKVGGVVGKSSRTVSHCDNHGTVTGTSIRVSGTNSYLGGIAGTAETLTECCNTGEIVCPAHNEAHESHTGGIAGKATMAIKCRNSGMVENFGNEEDVNVHSYSKYIGGILGEGNAEHCNNSGDVCGSGVYFTYIGGVVGRSLRNNIMECRNTGNVSGDAYAIGGITASCHWAKIQACRNSGDVIGERNSSRVAGIVGAVFNDSTLLFCANEGNILRNGRPMTAGGVAGEAQTDSTIGNCYNAGQILPRGDYSAWVGSQLGGVLGYAYDASIIVSNCYNIGTITGSSKWDKIGGVIGNHSGSCTVEDCYYLVDCTDSESEFGTPLTELLMCDPTSFTNWNFNSVWERIPGSDYPYPTLRCFGSREYYYKVTFSSEGALISDAVVPEQSAITFTAPEGMGGLDFGYWERNGNRYYPGDELIITEDSDFRAIWITKNTSAWDGSIDTDWAGDGSEQHPYEISSAAELAGLAKTVNEDRQSWSYTYFRQTTDIVLNNDGDRFSETVHGRNEWVPIGNYADAFCGYYDGGGHSVTGLYISEQASEQSRPLHIGVFGRLLNGSITDLTVAESWIERIDNNRSSDSYGCYIGSIVGQGSYCTVRRCRNEGVVICSDVSSCVGGVAGICDVSACCNTGAVTGAYCNVGGVIGGGTASNCYNTGTVTGIASSSYTGGVAGRTEELDVIENCYSIGRTTGEGNYGGIVGFYAKDDVVRDSYYLGGCVDAGNALGQPLSTEQMYDPSTFSEWNYNSIWETDSESGFPILRCFGSRQYDYAIEYFDGDELLYQTLVRNGAVVLLRPALADRTGLVFGYWEISGRHYAPGEEYTPSADTVIHAVWLTRNTSADVWDGSIDTDWVGDGSELHPYEISSAAELAGLGYMVNSGANFEGKFFSQTKNILLNDQGERFDTWITGQNEWTPIGSGTTAFFGDYDGGGNTVSGLCIVDRNAIEDKTNYIGLFGRVEGAVRNLAVTGSYMEIATPVVVNGNAYRIGGIAGYAGSYGDTHSPLLSDCLFSGTICYRECSKSRSSVFVGGIVGYYVNYNEDSDSSGIKGCINYGAIQGAGSVGGIVGAYSNYRAISDCHNEGNITGIGTETGGIAGRGAAADCCNAGSVVADNPDVQSYLAGITGAGNVESCKNNGIVEGSGQWVGGISGSGNAVDCQNNGPVTGTRSNAHSSDMGYTGGIVGHGNQVENCCNTAPVTAAGCCTGGIAGYGTARQSYNTGKIQRIATESSILDNYTGGIVGRGTVSNCYNTGEVEGSGDYGYTAGIAGSGDVSCCYNIGQIEHDTWHAERVGGLIGEGSCVSAYYRSGCYTQNDWSSSSNVYGTPLSLDLMSEQASFEGFDFELFWTIGDTADYSYPTLQSIPHYRYYSVTFYDRDGTTVLSQQVILMGEDAVPPEVSDYSDSDYVYTFDHWDGSYTNVTANQTVTAVYRQVAIIKINGSSETMTVPLGFSREELRIELESRGRWLCTTTNGFGIGCVVVWDLSAYRPNQPGTYPILGHLSITDSVYYAMAEGAEVQVLVTVLPYGEAPASFREDDLTYDSTDDGSGVILTGYLGTAAELPLPDSLHGLPVVGIADSAFAGNAAVTVVWLPAGLKTVGAHAFDGCVSLAQVTFRDALESIGPYAFYGTGMVGASLPAGLNSIGEKALGYFNETQTIEGFRIYCFDHTEAQRYAAESGLETVLLDTQTDPQSGISIIAEDDLILVVAAVDEESYQTAAEQILELSQGIVLFDISLQDTQAQAVQPGGIVTIRIPVPEGFDPEHCVVYRINSDGTYKEMAARLVDGMLEFQTPHLSCYAVIQEHVHNYIAAVTEPTCTEGGYTTYTCADCGDSYVDDEVPALGHDWNEPTYEWAEDNSSVTAARTCKNGASHIEAETVTTTSKVTKEATYTEEGEIVYTAVFENEAFETQTKAVATPKLEQPPVEFTDVPAGAYYEKPVAWAVANGITNGTGNGKFSPDATCTRGQVVTFLWRAKGSPEPSSTENPFTDVKETDYFYKAVLWAKETGVTSGTSATTFSPGNGCTRAQVVTFLWRAEGKPESASTNNPFTDVPAGQYYTKAVLWAVENGVTTGTGATAFSPDKTCTRGQIVTFLYRDLA